MRGDLVDMAGMFPDEGRLERIEAKLDWLRWRMRWGEQRGPQTAEERELASSPLMCTFMVDIGPEPKWPERKP